MTNELSGGNYWDWVSAQDQMDYTDVEDLKTLIQDCYEFLKPFLDRMVWVECNTIYLNQIHRISQTDVGNYLGISQYGVSKRLRTAIRRLKMKLKCPETDNIIARRELGYLFGDQYITQVMSYYIFNSNQVNRELEYSTPISLSNIVNILQMIISDPEKGLLVSHYISHLPRQELESHPEYHKVQESVSHTSSDTNIVLLAEKYLPYFQIIDEITTTGESVFKNEDLRDED